MSVEVEFQLNVTGFYETEGTSLKKIKEAVKKAIDEIATCDMVEVLDATPTDGKLPRGDQKELEKDDC